MKTPRKRAAPKPKAAAVKPDDPFSGTTPQRRTGGEDAVPDEVTRDGYGRYLIGPKGVRGKAYSRATTIAKTISDTYVLSKWGERMVAKGLMMRPDLRSLVAATPLEERDALNSLCEQAKDAAGSKVSANLGTAMHSHTEALDRGLVDDAYLAQLEELEKADLSAYARALEEDGIEILPAYIERTVVVDEDGMEVAGTLDRIVRMADGTLRIADLKTGRDLSYGWNEIAIQEHIYARAKRIFNWKTRDFEPMPEGVDQDWALVMHLPIGSGVCTLYDVDLRPARRALELCFEVRDWRKERSIASVRSRTVARSTLPVTPLDRVRAATTRQELSALWQELKPLGLWTTALAAAGQDQLSKFTTA